MLQTNEDKLVRMAVQGEVIHPRSSGGYSTGPEGEPRIGLGMSGIKYNITVGDLCWGWEGGEHIEPGLTITNKDQKENAALSALACIGDEVEVITGDAKGAKGYIIGKHVNFMVWLKEEDQKKIHIEDKLQIEAWGVGLKIKGYEDIFVNKIAPPLLQKMGIKIKDGKLVVPIAAEFPAYIMGSGYGMWPVSIDYDIETTCPTSNDELNLKNIRFGDVVALKDQLNMWGRGYYKDAVTIGIVIHGWSNIAGHGPGVTTILSAMSGKISTVKDPNANIAYYLGIRERPKK